MTEIPANRKKWRRYILNVSSRRSPISRGRRRSGAGALNVRAIVARWRVVKDARGGSSELGLGCRRGWLLVLVLHRRELQRILSVHVDLHRVATRDLSTQQVLGQLVLDPVRDHAPQRARPVDAVIALFGQQVLGRIGDLDDDLLLDQVLA